MIANFLPMLQRGGVALEFNTANVIDAANTKPAFTAQAVIVFGQSGNIAYNEGSGIPDPPTRFLSGNALTGNNTNQAGFYLYERRIEIATFNVNGGYNIGGITTGLGPGSVIDYPAGGVLILTDSSTSGAASTITGTVRIRNILIPGNVISRAFSMYANALGP